MARRKSVNDQKRIKRGNNSNTKHKSKRIILVAYEGKNKTESLYFSNFNKNRLNDYRIIIVNGNETDPVHMVKQLKKTIYDYGLNLEDDDKAYCIFDTDIDFNKDKLIEEAIREAQGSNINIITSSPCFEIWGILHFEDTTGYMDNKQAQNKLKLYIPKYEKNYDIFEETIEYINTAIKNSKKLNKYHKDLGRNINKTESNPSSQIYKIIEEILK